MQSYQTIVVNLTDGMLCQVAVDFFGRPIVRPQNDQPKASEKIEKVRVMYRFSEGNSAAVRKPVKVGAFL
jgi:chromosome transmission fidelity protein 18